MFGSAKDRRIRQWEKGMRIRKMPNAPTTARMTVAIPIKREWYWEGIADNRHKAGWSVGYVSAVGP